MKRQKFSSPEQYFVYEVFKSASSNEDLITTINHYTEEDKHKLREIVEKLLSELSEYRERTGEIFSLRIGLRTYPHTLEEIAVKFWITRERARGVIFDACSFLRNPNRAVACNEFLPIAYRVDLKTVITRENALDMPFFSLIRDIPGVFSNILRTHIYDVEGDITTREFLERYSVYKLLRIPRLGKKTLFAVLETLERYGLSLKVQDK